MSPSAIKRDNAKSKVAADESLSRTDLFSGGGELGALVRDFDWSATPLGDSARWPQSLKTVVRVLLASRFAMWMGWGPDLTFLYNDAYARMTLGKKHPWALGKPAREVWAEIWHDLSPRIQRVLDTGEATWDEALLLFLERSGYREETYHTFSYSPLTGDDGRVAGNFCVVSEETERIIGERRLGTLRSLAAELSTTSTEQDVMAATGRSLCANTKDLPFTLTYLATGEAHVRLACRTGIEANHSGAPGTIPVSTTDGTWPVAEVLNRNTSVRVDNIESLFGQLPTGSWDESPVSALLVPIASQAQETPAGIFVSALNPYRQLDASYSGFINLIAGQIAGSLANARAYEQERKRAESLAELDRAKTKFFSNVSHEFRTPLTLMLGPLEELLAKTETEILAQNRHLAQVAHRNGTRLLKLVNTLLDFSRIEAGRMNAVYRPTDLAVFTSELASLFRSATDRAGLKLNVECDRLDEPVYVDRDMWEKIVFNLLSNAFKFTFEGELSVRLTAGADAVELIVRDTGVGIPEQELPRLFERFHRVEGTRGRSFEGSGIGLALVQELVKFHGGRIWVDSNLGKGTAFHVSVPLGSKHLPQSHVSDVSVEPEYRATASPYVAEALSWLAGDPSADGGGQFSRDLLNPVPTASEAPVNKSRVLLVDDNRDMREYVRRLLNDRFDVATAENGRVALNIALKNPPDIVLSDVMMPEMDGFELLSALRKHPATSTVPIILLSARAGAEARIEGIQQGADDYLVKPFGAGELIARIQTHVELARLRSEALEAVQLRTEQFQTLLDHAPLGVYLVDSDLRIRQVNPVALPVFGNIPDLVGRPFDEVVHVMWNKPYADELVRIFRHTLQTGEPYETRERVEYRVDWKVMEYYEWRVDRIALPEGGYGAVCYFRDISAQVKARDALAHQEERLRRTEKLAAAGQLAASLAHEINNPLSSVTNALYLLRRDAALHPEAKDLASIASKELARVSSIVKQSLSYYRVGTAPKEFDLGAVVEDSVQIFAEKFRRAGVNVSKEIKPGADIIAFADEVRQVIDNLLLNALEATRNGGHIKISVHPTRNWRNQRQRGVRLSIADTGTGIPKENLSRLFEPFFTTKPEKGTGLGLWVVRGIVAKHDASLRIRSSEGDRSGTVISIFWPSSVQGHSAPISDSAAQVG